MLIFSMTALEDFIFGSVSYIMVSNSSKRVAVLHPLYVLVKSFYFSRSIEKIIQYVFEITQGDM